MIRLALLAATLSLTSLATAQTADTPQRIRNVQVAKGQPCPRSNPTEVVVCSTIEDPYRIPKEFRDDGPIEAANQSWVNRAATVDQVSRTAGGLPDTCSPIGTGGQSGCAQAQSRAYAAEKRAQARAAESVPGGAD